MIGLSSNIDTSKHDFSGFLVKSWSLSLGKVNLFWVKDGVTRATIFQGDGRSSYICNILGLQKHWMSSPAVLRQVLSDAYAILNQSSNREFFLRIAPRICGGGHGHSKDSSDNDRSDAGSSSSERDISHDRHESVRADKAADTKQMTSSDRDITDQSSKPELQKDKEPALDRQEVSQEKQQSDQSNQGGSEEKVSPSSTENAGSHLSDLAAEAAVHIAAEVMHLGAAALLLQTSELNKGEEEYVAEQFLKQMDQKGESIISNIQRQIAEQEKDTDRKESDRSDYNMPEPEESHSWDCQQDADRERFDPRDYQDSAQERSDRSWSVHTQDVDRWDDMSDYRDKQAGI